MPPEPLQPTPHDRLRMEPMLRTARDARAILGSSDAATLRADMIRTRAPVNCFTEIGEAAAKLTPVARNRVGQLPWRDIVHMRNVVVHVYWGIDLQEIVDTVTDDLPGFAAALETAPAAWPPARQG